MSKNKFSETRVGKFLKEKAPDLAGEIVGLAGDVFGIDMLKKAGDMIKGSDKLSPEDKELALKKWEFDILEMQEVTKRWDSDMKSDSWLSKNVRPLTLVYLTLVTTIIIVLDSSIQSFKVGEEWIFLLKTLLLSVYVAYFGSRGYEKITKIKK